MSSDPIFIGGAGRSGTTLLRVILDSHSRIACGPEIKVIPQVCWQRDILFGHEAEFKEARLDPLYLDSLYRRLIVGLLDPYRMAMGKARAAEKSPANVFWFPTLARLFPHSPLIHVIRDGRDVVASLLRQNWLDPKTGDKPPYITDPAAAAKYWAQCVEAGRSCTTANYIEVRYEALVSEPEATLQRLFMQIREEWEPEVLAYAAKRHGRGPQDNVFPEISARQVGRYRHDLTFAQLEAVMATAGTVLEELGYYELEAA